MSRWLGLLELYCKPHLIQLFTSCCRHAGGSLGFTIIIPTGVSTITTSAKHGIIFVVLLLLLLLLASIVLGNTLYTSPCWSRGITSDPTILSLVLLRCLVVPGGDSRSTACECALPLSSPWCRCNTYSSLNMAAMRRSCSSGSKSPAKSSGLMES